MVRTANDMPVAQPADDVFDFLADVKREPQWNPAVIAVEQTSTGPIGLGSYFRGTYKQIGVLESEITRYDRPRQLGFHTVGKLLQLDFTFQFDALGGGTLVRSAAEIEPKGWMWLLRPVIGPMMRHEFATCERMRKKALEGDRLASRDAAVVLGPTRPTGPSPGLAGGSTRTGPSGMDE